MELALLAAGVLILVACFVSVRQGTIAVITVFGKYSRIMRPGLNFKLPLIQKIYKRISIQNRSVELEFQATTIDQANVNFKAMLLFAVLNQEEETIKNVAFKFMDDRSFMQALIRTIEGSIRSFVATKKIQAEVATGSSLTGSMQNTAAFTNMVVMMVSIGEESGSLDSMLSKVADFFEAEVDDAVDALASLMEPMIMVVLGTLIGGMVVAMYLPIFKMGQAVG